MDNTNKTGHSFLTLRDRKEFFADGVKGILSSDETAVRLDTVLGNLTVYGTGLVVDDLSGTDEKIKLHGSIEGIEFDTGRKRGGGLFR